jgi:hypothetical protein
MEQKQKRFGLQSTHLNCPKSQTIIMAKTYIAANSLQGIFSYVRDVCKDISNPAPQWQQNREVKRLKSYNTNVATGSLDV